MKDRIVLLKEVEHLCGQEVCDLLTVDGGNMRHKLAVVDNISGLFGRIKLKIAKFFDEYVEMDLKLLLVRLGLSFNPVL